MCNGIFPDRTLESVKCQRKQADYKVLVESELTRLKETSRQPEKEDIGPEDDEGLDQGLGSGFEARESTGEPELGSTEETTPLNAQHEAAFEDCFRRYWDPERGSILAELLESNQITELTPMVIQEGFLKWLASTG